MGTGEGGVGDGGGRWRVIEASGAVALKHTVCLPQSVGLHRRLKPCVKKQPCVCVCVCVRV